MWSCYTIMSWWTHEVWQCSPLAENHASYLMYDFDCLPFQWPWSRRSSKAYDLIWPDRWTKIFHWAKGVVSFMSCLHTFIPTWSISMVFRAWSIFERLSLLLSIQENYGSHLSPEAIQMMYLSHCYTDSSSICCVFPIISNKSDNELVCSMYMGQIDLPGPVTSPVVKEAAAHYQLGANLIDQKVRSLKFTVR